MSAVLMSLVAARNYVKLTAHQLKLMAKMLGLGFSQAELLWEGGDLKFTAHEKLADLEYYECGNLYVGDEHVGYYKPTIAKEVIRGMVVQHAVDQVKIDALEEQVSNLGAKLYNYECSEGRPLPVPTKEQVVELAIFIKRTYGSDRVIHNISMLRRTLNILGFCSIGLKEAKDLIETGNYEENERTWYDSANKRYASRK